MKSANPEMLRKWLEAAYIKGARDMAQHSLDALNHYAKEAEGLPSHPTLSDSYQTATTTLMVHYAKVLQAAEFG